MPRKNSPHSSASNQHRLNFAQWTLDTEERTLHRDDGHTVHLSSSATKLLVALAAQPSVPLSREQLASAIGRKYLPYDRLIDVLVSQIRRSLGSQPDGTPYIRTLRSVGYVFIAPTSRR